MAKNSLNEWEQENLYFDVYNRRNSMTREADAVPQTRGQTVPPDIMQLKTGQQPGIFFGKGRVDRLVVGPEPTRKMLCSTGKNHTFRHILDKETASLAVGKPFRRYVGKPVSMDGHAIGLGGTGSGKGACLAKPTLEAWCGPIVVHDPKGELCEHYLSMSNPNKRPIKIFDPSRDTGVFNYDPFSSIIGGGEANRVANVRELAGALIPLSADTKIQFWDRAARKFLTGAFLHCIEKGANFSTSFTQIAGPDVDKLIKEIANSKSIAAQMCVRSYKGKKGFSESEMLRGIIETLDTRLMEIATDIKLMTALSPSDNSINWERDLEKYNIFINIPPDKADVWGPVSNIIVSQLLQTLKRRPEKHTPEGENLEPVLLLLDEFTIAGPIAGLPNALSVLRSKKVSMFLLAQSIAQLDDIYGASTRRIMLDNCDFKAVLRVNDAESQRYFAELAGTVPAMSRSYSYNRSYVNTNYSESNSETREPFVRPEELAHLDKDLILYTPYGTFRVPKAPRHEWQPETF
jgi:type IV secretion system protein VirD4